MTVIKDLVATHPVMTVYVKLTNACNLQCKHCYNSVCSSYLEMDANTLERVYEYIKDLSETSFVNVIYHGGEPMLYKNLDDIFYLTAHLLTLPTVSITATTNLMYKLSPAVFNIINLFRDINSVNATLQTSWDAGTIRFATPEMKELWEKNVLELKNQTFVNIQPIVCLTKDLLSMEPSEFFEYMQQYTNVLNFDRLTRTGRATKNTDIIPTNAELDNWLCRAYETNKKYRFSIPLFEEFELASTGVHVGCRARICSKTVRTINPDCTVATCPNVPLSAIHSLASEETIRTPRVTNTDEDTLAHIEFRKDTRCYECPRYTKCNGDCYQLSWDDTGCPGMPLLQDLISKEYK